MDKICRCIFDEKAKIKFESVELLAGATDIQSIIELDKQIPAMQPMNGKFFTYKILNKDVEVTNLQVRKAVAYAYESLWLYTKATFKLIRSKIPTDFTIVFRSESEDPLLTSNTIAYHFYPINDLTSPNRGICVVNTRFYFTASGEGVSMHDIDPIHYPEGTQARNAAIDLDKIFRHEFRHGVSGNAHDPLAGNLLSSSEEKMSEQPSDRDIARDQAKLGTRSMASWLFNKWFKFLNYRTENY